jgi:hypothetical protein
MIKGAGPEQAQQRGFALRQEQRLIEADRVFTDAVAHPPVYAPANPALLFGHAQTRYELGLPAATLFATAQAAMPANLDITRNHAAAMAAEGDRTGAEQLLRRTLKAQPGWLDGHKGLATLRWTSGDVVHFADSYGEACREQPGNAALWLAWFAAVAQTKDWPTSLAILAEAERHIGTTAVLLSARLFVAVEGGGDADALLAATAHIQGDTIKLCRIRHALRQGRFEQAQALLLPLVKTPSAGLFWPYLSLVWRLLGDDRHVWLDRPDAFIQQGQIGLTAAELAELADVLRGLHTMEKPYVEQTVRGGTQTDRSVLLRHEPILQRTREAVMAVVRGHIATLPPAEEGHPFLGTPLDARRGHLLLGGSWSVRLGAGGHNVPHTHPMGWMSASLYVAIPDAGPRGPAPAGHISFGQPPAELGLTELGLELPAYRSIAPQPGLVVTFPSTLWHSVVPFSEGERLMIALDIRRPGS